MNTFWAGQGAVIPPVKTSTHRTLRCDHTKRMASQCSRLHAGHFSAMYCLFFYLQAQMSPTGAREHDPSLTPAASRCICLSAGSCRFTSCWKSKDNRTSRRTESVMCVGASGPFPVFPLPTNMKCCEHVKFSHSRNAACRAALRECLNFIVQLQLIRKR